MMLSSSDILILTYLLGVFSSKLLVKVFRLNVLSLVVLKNLLMSLLAEAKTTLWQLYFLPVSPSTITKSERWSFK